MFCSICEGREVVRMQDELAKLGLVPVLKDLFDSLDWDAPIPTGPQESHGLHGPGCECNPEMVSHECSQLLLLAENLGRLRSLTCSQSSFIWSKSETIEISQGSFENSILVVLGPLSLKANQVAFFKKRGWSACLHHLGSGHDQTCCSVPGSGIWSIVGRYIKQSCLEASKNGCSLLRLLGAGEVQLVQHAKFFWRLGTTLHPCRLFL
jgi:hypothetical protein